MIRQNLSEIRLVLGVLTGLLLWLIWQTSAITSPDSASVNYANFLANLPPGWMDFFRPWTHEEFVQFFHINPPYTDPWWTFGREPTTDAAIIHTWIGFLPLACLFGVLFSIVKPLPRFLIWIVSLGLVSAIVFYCFQSFNYLLPLTQPIIVLSCFYLCGTVIYLETEKIERNRNLAIDLQRNAEDERKRIAKDLHDESLQSLSRVIRLIDKLSDEIPDNPAPKEIRERLETCVSGTRNIINDLHPSSLDEFGLATSLEYLVEEFGHSTGVKTKFDDKSTGIRPTTFHELCFYRIAQEALNNIEKHSGASQMCVSIEYHDQHLLLKISDNGKGTVQKKRDSHGLQNIEDRAKLMNGTAEWKKPDEFESGIMLVVRAPILKAITDSRNSE